MGKRKSTLEAMERMKTFYKRKKIFVTGHTGFKGVWLCQILLNFGAEIVGYSLEPPTTPNLFSICHMEKNMQSIKGDIRDYEKLKRVMNQAKPDIVFHLAAQPLVRESYHDPVYTYETNVIGTVNLLDCIRDEEYVRSFLNVTTDKVYDNCENDKAYKENDTLDGYDPYSNSKSCSELVTHSYKRSFFADKDVAISTARAGNVIGGGDFAKDRIIPDCVRAAEAGRDIIVRNPYSIRPYQYVLDPLMAYLIIAMRQYEDKNCQGCYNVGPDDCDCVTTGQLVDIFCKHWGNMQWINKYDGGPHEAQFLKLNCDLIKDKLNWQPRWNIDKAVQGVVQWTKEYMDTGNVLRIMDAQIGDFVSEK